MAIGFSWSAVASARLEAGPNRCATAAADATPRNVRRFMTGSLFCLQTGAVFPCSQAICNLRRCAKCNRLHRCYARQGNKIRDFARFRVAISILRLRSFATAKILRLGQLLFGGKPLVRHHHRHAISGYNGNWRRLLFGEQRFGQQVFHQRAVPAPENGVHQQPEIGGKC